MSSRWRQRKTFCGCVAGCVVALAAGAVRGQATEAAPGAQWVPQLGARDFEVRERATRELTALGDAALPVLRKELRNADPEIAQRVDGILRTLTYMPPDQVMAVTLMALGAYSKADYPFAIKQQALLARRRFATVDECLKLGHYCQRAEDYAGAVAGYHRALERVDDLLAGELETEPPPAGRANRVFGNTFRIDDVGGSHNDLLQKRAGLILMIGRLQREQLNDAVGAAATLARVVDFVPEFQGDAPGLLGSIAAALPEMQSARVSPDTPWPQINRGLALTNEFLVLEELARTQEALHHSSEALLARARQVNALLKTRDFNSRNPAASEMAELSRLLAATNDPAIRDLPAAAELLRTTPPAAPRNDVRAAPAVVVSEPFQATRTNLGTFNLGPLVVRDMARLPDGRWFAAINAGPRIVTATSRDLVTWDEPKAVAAARLGNNTNPALLVDAHGTIWMAWFSNRLSLNLNSSGGYTLWLARSEDGVKWSPPRAVRADTGGWPMGSLNWLTLADGTIRLSWRAAAAMAKSPGEIAALGPVDVPVMEGTWPMDPFVTADATGRLHMVLSDNIHNNIMYRTSTDGRNWTEQRTLVEKSANGLPPTQPQMFVEGAGCAVFYQVDGALFFKSGTLAELPTLNAAVRITTRAANTHWVRAGDALYGLVAGETPVLMTAKLADVFSAR